MSDEARGLLNENTIDITPEKLQEIKACIRNKDATQDSLFGMVVGATVTGLPLVFAKDKITRGKAAIFLVVGAIYGHFISRYFRIKSCVAKVITDPNAHINISGQPGFKDTLGVNIYENKKSRLENQELAKTEDFNKISLFDTESPPQMNMFDDFPVINESVDVEDNNEPERTLTYNELRQKNRENYNPGNIVQKPMWARNRSKEQPVQGKEFETESKEPDFFPEHGARKHKTKYGDVWD